MHLTRKKIWFGRDAGIYGATFLYYRYKPKFFRNVYRNYRGMHFFPIDGWKNANYNSEPIHNPENFGLMLKKGECIEIDLEKALACGAIKVLEK